MEVATTAASSFALHTRMLAPPTSPRALSLNRIQTTSSCSPLRASSLSTNSLSPFVTSDFSGRPNSPNPASFRSSKPKRSVVTNVIPFHRGSAWEQPPPDLASYLFKNRIVYLGMPLVPSVTELLFAEFIWLENDDNTKPIYFYINSTGITKNGEKLGYETEALAIYSIMSYVKAPIFTLCVGNCWGEAALLLAAGARGNRAALPSSTIMLKQPIGRVQGQGSDIERARREITKTKAELIELYAMHIRKSPKQIDADMRRPKYFSPTEAVEYGIIDKVLYNEKGDKDKGVVSALKKAKLI